MPEVWEYIGPPTPEEITKRYKYGNNQLSFRHRCIYCGDDNTEFIRQEYWICYNCLTWFSVKEAIDNYNNSRTQHPQYLSKNPAPSSMIPKSVPVLDEYDKLKNLLKGK